MDREERFWLCLWSVVAVATCFIVFHALSYCRKTNELMVKNWVKDAPKDK